MTVTVSIPAPEMPTYQGWSPCILWCDRNCVGDWYFWSEGVFTFDLDSDATMFKLKWG